MGAVNEEIDGAWVVDDLPDDEEEELVVAIVPEALRPWVALIDSGTTCHISPYCDKFTNYRDSPVWAFQAANKQSFSAVGSGDLTLELPNGTRTSTLTLTDVLYSPDVGYTLVSIGKLNALGYSISFDDGMCTIHSPNNSVVGRIPKSAHGLYKVTGPTNSPETDAGEGSALVTPQLTVMELHRHMGHIALGTAKKLVTDGLVSGIDLQPEGQEPTFCESCTYAKALHKPLLKEHDPEHCMKAFG